MINRNNAISLSSLQNIIKNELYNINSYWIIAEINEFKINYNNHCFLELVEKDDCTQNIKSRISAVIWASFLGIIKSYFEAATGQELKSGINVLVKVQVQYHELYGLNLNIIDIDPSFTIGDMQLKKQNVIVQLKDDGVFELNKELPFPVFPQRIAVISSKNAAGYSDFMKQIQNNEYGFVFKITLFDSVMQGINAESSIISAFEKIYENHDLFDVIVIIRGGGSNADLLCFDLYSLVYNATQLPLPFLTGIGHDKDISILDMVAYKMLKTPTAVADFILNQCLYLEKELNSNITQLKYIVNYKTTKNKNNLVNMHNKIKLASSKYFYKERLLMENIFPDKLKSVSLQRIEKEKAKTDIIQNRLNSLNPLNILSKGYSITFNKGKRINKDTVINKDDEIETFVYDKKILSTVKQVDKNGKNDL